MQYLHPRQMIGVVQQRRDFGQEKRKQQRSDEAGKD